jgi:hypothetical protein
VSSQNIIIDSTFTSDGEIYPFSPNDTIYGLSVSGTIELYSDTSLVRVILVDEDYNEFMVYEAYPLIVTDTAFSIVEGCDETCFLDEIIPQSIIIHLSNASIKLDSITLSSQYQENLDLLQYQSKRIKDAEKIENMNEYIQNQGWNWYADSTYFVKQYYFQKRDFFGEHYNLLGIDYYVGGIYSNYFLELLPAEGATDLTPDFDWREKHDAHIPNSHYWDGDLNSGEQGNGWMTGIRDQGTCNSCSAFGAVATLEGFLNLYYNYHIDSINSIRLSERDVFNCSDYYYTYVGCSCDIGKERLKILEYIKDEWMVTNECFQWPPDTTEPFCEGELLDCDSSSFKCPPEERDPLFSVEDWIQFNLDDYSSFNFERRSDYLKSLIIENGPLYIEVNKLFGEEMPHAVSLVGYLSDSINNSTIWIMKNSWGLLDTTPLTDTVQYNAGYVLSALSLSDDPQSNSMDKLVYSFTYPEIQESNPFYDINMHTFDKDRDGYYNWGIEELSVVMDSLNWTPPCDTNRDWNDNNNRIGPADTCYFGIPVQPVMNVYSGHPAIGEPVENKGFLYFDENDLTNNKLTIYIENAGDAYINLESDNPVTEIQDINGCFNPITTEIDTQICWINGNYFTTFEIYFDLQCQVQDDNPPLAVFKINVDSVDQDVLDDFEFAAVYYECDSATGTYYVDQNEIWDEYKVITKDVKIKTGKTLEITGNVEFVKYGDIYVEGGAELKINGGILSGACDEFWNGIDVWGDDEYPQFDGRQGKVKLLNGGTISHALCAVETGIEAIGYYIPTGGIVQSYGGVFKDNIIGVRFYPYQNFNPQTSEPANNLSRFKNTGFITTQFLYGMEVEPSESAIPETFVDLQLVEGILFKGNTFQNLATTNDESRGTGIRSGTAGFYVYNECAVPNTTPCPEYYISRFEHLDYGIMVLGDRESLPIVIDSATFTDNKRGILLSGVNNAEIFHNTFEMDMPDSYHSTSDTLIGVYLEACQEFLLTENYFTGYSGTQMDHAAIYAHNLGAYYNEIYNNFISNLTCGIIAAGENRSENGTEGLCIKCNDFDHCEYDIYITSYGGLTPNKLGIAANQGIENPPESYDNTLAAGNTFSSEAGLVKNYVNKNCNHIDYVYHGNNYTDEKIVPDPFEGDILPKPDFRATYTTKTEACPSQLSGGINPTMENNTIISESVIISLYDDTLSTYTDGGDTEGLNLEVYTSMPPDALQIRQELMNESPYLSDTVMNTAILKENVLPNVMIRDVLVANPQSAKSVSVMQTLDQRFDPMPDYMMAEIMQGQEIIGAKEVYEQKLAKHKRNKYTSFDKLIRYYKGDTVNVSASFDSLVNLLQNEQDLGSRYRLSMLYLYHNDSANAFSTLNNIPNEFALDQKEVQVFDLYSDLCGVLWQIKTDTMAPDSICIQILFEIAESQKILPGVYARNMLVGMHLLTYYEPISFPGSLKSEEYVNSYDSSPEAEEIMRIFPNPAGDYFIVYYKLPSEIKQPILVISGINGKPIQSIKLIEPVNQLVVSMNNYPAGVYLVNIFSGNKIISGSKVIVSR